VQEAKIPMEGFNFENTDNSDMFNGSQTKNIVELQHAIDSLDLRVTEASSKSYEPLMKDNIFTKDIQVLQLPDSLMIDKSDFRNADMLDSLSKLDIRKRHQIWTSARSSAINSRNSLTFDESSAKIALTQLYRSKNDWHNKLALPVSVFIFFLIGAPLGAIIRKGGLGTPIVISVAFFVFYYIISLNGKKAAEEGLWSSFTGMWLSSFVLTPIAVYLLIKATNDSSLLDTDWYYNRYIAFKERFNIIWLPVKSRISSWGICKKLGSIKFRKAKKSE
jgi:lipopolysaccharide export system permease protein